MSELVVGGWGDGGLPIVPGRTWLWLGLGLKAPPTLSFGCEGCKVFRKLERCSLAYCRTAAGE